MLRCVSRYRATVSIDGTSLTLVYLPGELVTDDTLAAWLMRDAPACFETVEAASDEGTETRALDAAPADRMMRPARKRTMKATVD